MGVVIEGGDNRQRREIWAKALAHGFYAACLKTLYGR